MHSSLPIISVLVGLALLLFGRRLFWLFVAALGFAIGLQLAPYLSQNPPLWLSLLLSLGLGLLGALLAVVLQKLAIAIAGFLVGARDQARAFDCGKNNQRPIKKGDEQECANDSADDENDNRI